MTTHKTEQNTRIAVLVVTGDRSLAELMSADRIRSVLRTHSDVAVVEFESWNGNGAAARIARLCADQHYTGVVLCGPSSQTSLLPEMITIPVKNTAIPVTCAPIQEHCLTEARDKTAAAAKADRLLEMAVTRARGVKPATLVEVDAERTVAVVGGNHAAYQTAAALVGSGFPVVLVDTGRPDGCFFPLPQSVVHEVTSRPDVERLVATSVDQVAGCLGAFELHVLTHAGRRKINAGALVVAIDAQIGRLELAPPLEGCPRVIDLRQFGERVDSGRIDGQSVCVWLDRSGPDRRCAGRAALHYCLEHSRNGGRATMLFQNVPVYGQLGQVLYDDARSTGVTFIRTNGVPPRFSVTGKEITVAVEDAVLAGRTLQFRVDRLVVPAPVVPSPHNTQLANLLHQSLDIQGYLQSGNVRHRPTGSARKGVFFVGGCHDECDPDEARVEAEAVLAELMAQLPEGRVLVPSARVILNKGSCAGCLTCVRMCPHGAIDPPPSGRWMEYHDPACYQCGICASVCPGQALEHGSMPVGQMHDMLRVATADLQDHPPIVAFGCRQSVIPAADGISREGLSFPDEILLIDVPCAGLVSENLVLEALLLGARGVLVLGCHHDNCRSMWGSDLAHKRIDKLKRNLEVTGTEGRIQFSSLAANESHRLAHLLAAAVAEIPEGRIGEKKGEGE